MLGRSRTGRERVKVVEGGVAPEFSLRTDEGRRWSLTEHRGRPVVLYFYPKDATAGCTLQARDVRDRWAQLSEFGAEVVGISPDDEASHRGFRLSQDLPQTLLVDEHCTVLKAYGAWGTKIKEGVATEGVIRSSVVISSDGVVVALRSPIDPSAQADFALEGLASTR